VAGNELKIDILGIGGAPVLDTFPPFCDLLTPLDGDIDVLRNTDVVVLVDDLESGVDLLGVEIRLQQGVASPVLAYDGDGGGFQPGFTGSVVAGGVNGAVITINPNTDFDNFELITVLCDVTDNDGNTGNDVFTFTTADTVGPVVVNCFPPDLDTNVLPTTLISFRIQDEGAGIDLTTVQVTIQFDAGPLQNAVINGVIQAPYNGASSAVDLVGNGYNFVLDPTGVLPEGITVTVTINGAWQTAVTEAFAENDGGRVITSAVAGVPDGTYEIHVGPNEDISDPVFYSGVPGQGSSITVEGGVFTGVIPTLPVGGPYRFFFVDLASPATYLSTPKVQIVPHQMLSKVYGLKRSLPPRWLLGPRRVESERFPQP
jgi:hypothetical protein